MEQLREEFKDGEVPQELLKYRAESNEGLNGEWKILDDHRSDGLNVITNFFGLDPKDRATWEWCLHISSPRVFPHPPIEKMAPGCSEGTFLAAEIDGILFAKYQMERGTLYMTRILLKEDPEGKETGPITMAQYCVVSKEGEKHTRSIVQGLWEG
ncbi:hypothetical protein, conserved [Eimeria acervulina]|uniref:Uncharacterized protein n=1 Tax=Eimeria acervulina TaxID=5801 RepID=U6GZ11_EIMAC|nr:hypothetical protein, conserved [Eimeria acervulina]CDI83769.1 hypothetical protein, conserved [Eimeria acervulina]